MAQQAKPKVTKAEIADSQSMWDGFTVLMRYSIYAIAGILVLMAAFLL